MISKRRAAGAVLLTTIIMVAVLAIAVLSLMQAVLLYAKASSHVAINHQEFYQLEAAALEIGFSKQAAVAPCLVRKSSQNEIIKQLLRDDGCVKMVGQRQYHYLVDDLGEHPCLQILRDKLPVGSHHWLISVATATHVILQLRMAKPETTSECRQVEKRIIYEGVISWRYLQKQ